MTDWRISDASACKRTWTWPWTTWDRLVLFVYVHVHDPEHVEGRSRRGSLAASPT